MSDTKSPYLAGRRLVQTPGPTNVPRAVLEAIGRPTIDHRGPEFADLTRSLLRDLPMVFQTEQPVVLYPGSGTGAWEACIANTLSAGDKVLTVETGHFAALWAQLAARFGLDVERIDTDWRTPVDAGAIEARLSEDSSHEIKALLITHNETSTGTTSDIAAVRRALDAAHHPALLFVDAVSSLASIDYRHDEWGVDVTIAGSQKGLMMPPGVCFNALSERALAASSKATLPRAYWEWQPILEANKTGYYPYTPPTNLLFGLQTALELLFEEGLEAVFARHLRHAEATRAAVGAWGLELQCTDASAQSPTVTAVRMPEGYSESEFRAVLHSRYGMALGAGLGRLVGSVFRIGHLGDFDDLSLIATLSGVELALGELPVPHQKGGVAAALGVLGN